MNDQPRNIVVCCDGTSNQFSTDLTNVAKLTYALVKDSERQFVYYQPGLGTRAAPGFPLPIGNALARGAGLAFGYGIKDDIRDAYLYIMNQWRPGDRLFLFGFSRGAYTVRALASLIHSYGVTMPGNEALVPYAIRMLWKMAGAKGDKFGGEEALANRYRDSLAFADCPIHFMGVWDTVSSVGWIGSPLSLPYTRSNPSITHVRHAVSIDEHRAFFRTNLFVPAKNQDLVQVWFPGDHCDVGGGHLEHDSGLSKYALDWMIAEAEKCGLIIDEDRRKALVHGRDGEFWPESPEATLHEKIPWYWKIAEVVPKRHWNGDAGQEEWRLNLGRRRNLGDAPVVHPVAWEIKDYEKRLPPGATKATL
jgi:uncharacterized protein (DUF2235 family)